MELVNDSKQSELFLKCNEYEFQYLKNKPTTMAS